jgi:hypothetical protein
MVNTKNKGNRYENKESKNLGIWFFNDKDALYRHENSGARKNVYVGDIIPKKIENFPWKIWPFVIEMKNGYKNNIPTFCGNRKTLDSWLIKLLSERTELQWIPILIAQFHQKSPILLTPIIFDYHSVLAYPINFNNECYIFYIYNYSLLLKEDFYKIAPSDIIFNLTDKE